MVDVWKCARHGHWLAVGDDLRPEGRVVVESEGHTCQGKLHVQDVEYLHCRLCEDMGECPLCNYEYGVASLDLEEL